jgi:hypothetical protein
MTDSLARIPFSPRDEGRIDSASRWMRFIAIVQIVGAVIGLVVLVVLGSIVSLFGAEIMQKLREAAEQEGAKVDLDAVLAAPIGVILFVVGVIAFASLAVQLWASMVLYRAGDNFAQVAATDVADQDFLADGFTNLKTYFYIEAVFAVLAAINAALGLLGMGGVS